MSKGRTMKNDEGSIYYDKSRDIWRCWYYVVNPVTLKKQRKCKCLKTQDEAKDFLATLKYQKEDILYKDNNGIPLNLLIKNNIEKKFDLGLIGGNQYNRLKRTLATIEKWDLSTKNIDELKSEEIQAYLNSLRDYSNSFITKIHELIYSAYNVAQKKGYIVRNPMVDVIKPKSTKKDRVIRAMTIEEQQTFTKYLMSKTIDDEPYKNVFLIQMYCGLRIGEALALRATDINLEKNLLKVDKTLTMDKNLKVTMGDTTKTYAGIREIPIPDSIRGSLIEQMRIAKNNRDGQLFLSQNGNLIDGRNANRILKIRLKELGIDGITTHSLRHTYGTRCVEAGMRAVALQRLMGHTDVSVTLNTYTSVFNKYKESELQKVNDYYLSNDIFSPEKLIEDNQKLLNAIELECEVEQEHE